MYRFCVVLVKPVVGPRSILPRARRVSDALTRAELDNDCPRGDILTFTQFADKRWTLSVHCVTLRQVSETTISLYSAVTLSSLYQFLCV